jgi:hypothetical protein
VDSSNDVHVWYIQVRSWLFLSVPAVIVSIVFAETVLRWDGFPQNRAHSPEQTRHPRPSSELRLRHESPPLVGLENGRGARERRRLIVSSGLILIGHCPQPGPRTRVIGHGLNIDQTMSHWRRLPTSDVGRCAIPNTQSASL